MSDLLTLDEVVAKYNVRRETVLKFCERNGYEDPLGGIDPEDRVPKVSDDWRLQKLVEKINRGRQL